MRSKVTFLFIALFSAVVLSSCGTPPTSQLEPTQKPVVAATKVPVASPVSDLTPTVEFTLRTESGHDGLAFVGVGGEIDGQMNPILPVNLGDVVKITLINGDGIQHNLVIDEFGVTTGDLLDADQQASVVFTADQAGAYIYYCSVPGHKQFMNGIVQVGAPAAAAATGADVVRAPNDLPFPLSGNSAEPIKVKLTAQEVVGQLADGTTYTYMTYDGKVPGPFIRTRVGDTVELTLVNQTSSTLGHSIDLHAVTGPGGGAVFTQVAPGETKTFTFKTLSPGLFVYHCATASIPHHISGGMYGLILVEPVGGLPSVDKEFYVMQGEIYTDQDFGTKGALGFDAEKMANEDADYVVFNGAVGSLSLASDKYALRADVGDTVRIYFGVGGPNYTSSFHVIGEIFDRAYPFAALTSPPLTDVQTVTVPPGGAAMVEFKLDVPGKYILVDHALSRLERGLVGLLIVEGQENPEIFHDGPATP